METAGTSSPPEFISFGRYIVKKLLGEGAMGKVFLAQDPVLNRLVAIKVISVDRHLDEKTRREFLARFSLEARLSAQLNHQSIVPVYDAGEEAGVPWIAFQYIDGVALDKIIQSRGKIGLKWSLHITLDIASALQLAHGQQIVHRDIKPGNIIVDRRGGIAKLADFGVAKVPWASLTCEGNAMGSPGYMSPEQIEGFSIDERSDLFSLGVVLYEMLTGRHPFVRETVVATAFATLSGKYVQAGELVTGIPARLDDVIARCLAPKPDNRIKSAAQLIELLRNLVPAVDSGSGAWPMLEDEKKSALKEIVSGIRSMVADGIRRLTPKKREPPTLVSVPIKPARHYPSPFLTRLRNGGRMALFSLRKGAAQTLDRLSVAVSLKTVGIVAFVGAVVTVLCVIVLVENGREGDSLYLPTAGLNAEQKLLISRSFSWAEAGKLDSAILCANALSVTREGAARGHFLRGIFSCQKGDFDEALAAFETAEKLPVGSRLIERSRRHIVSLCLPVLQKRRAPEALVSTLAKKCQAADHPAIKKAAYEKPYWSRWNAVRILQAAGRQVDLVQVFVLDLKYAKTMRTRLQAVRDLGDLNDRRAVPALIEARKKGVRDPFVSSAAAKMLKEVYKE
ncbi:MAG: serine/threonine protein kinase [Chitinispirillaceae bacterium]|nr:serine/threonine protein kinase [Chitinispirillaceae bacterium]